MWYYQITKVIHFCIPAQGVRGCTNTNTDTKSYTVQ